jgi:hypothetical protein
LKEDGDVARELLRKSNLEFKHVGAGLLANLEPFGKIIGGVVRRKNF